MQKIMQCKGLLQRGTEGPSPINPQPKGAGKAPDPLATLRGAAAEAVAARAPVPARAPARAPVCQTFPGKSST